MNYVVVCCHEESAQTKGGNRKTAHPKMTNGSELISHIHKEFLYFGPHCSSMYVKQQWKNVIAVHF